MVCNFPLSFCCCYFVSRSGCICTDLWFGLKRYAIDIKSVWSSYYFIRSYLFSHHTLTPHTNSAHDRHTVCSVASFCIFRSIYHTSSVSICTFFYQMLIYCFVFIFITFTAPFAVSTEGMRGKKQKEQKEKFILSNRFSNRSTGFVFCLTNRLQWTTKDRTRHSSSCYGGAIFNIFCDTYIFFFVRTRTVQHILIRSMFFLRSDFRRHFCIYFVGAI